MDGLVQDCRISITNTLEILQSCTKPLICSTFIVALLYTLASYITRYINTWMCPCDMVWKAAGWITENKFT